jgi:hypothetical protein
MTTRNPKALATLRRSRRRLIRKLEKLSQLDLFQERDDATKKSIGDLQAKLADTAQKIGRAA